MKLLDLLKTSTAAALCLCAVATVAPASQDAQGGFKVLYSFKFGNDGAFPDAGLIRDAAGNLYGTTYEGGGSSRCGNFGCGTVFKIAPDGTETVLHAFAGGSKDGSRPTASLIMDKAGNLYGTTPAGGGKRCGGDGCGTVFKIAPNGKETILYAFSGVVDGQYPDAGLTGDEAGNFYGTTEMGGKGLNGCTEGFGSGTIFEITRQGREKLPYYFSGPDGCLPQASLIRDAVGNLYGTTAYGGSGSGGGTVFRFAPDGTETVLHSFTGAPDGDVAESNLIMDKFGNLYGTTTYGGTRGAGAVFKVAHDGAESVLYSFCTASNCGDGSYPFAGLFRDSDRNLYGTTGYGGQSGCVTGNGCGVVFKIAPDGTEKVVHAFTGGSDGNFPAAYLIKDDAGHLYGTAGAGGADCGESLGRCGVVFRLDK